MHEKPPGTSSAGSEPESRNRVLLRHVNERMREILGPRLMPGEEAELLCECGDEACISIIRLGLEDYDAVRRSSYRFVVLPGHEDGEAIVEAKERFLVVEKNGVPH